MTDQVTFNASWDRWLRTAPLERLEQALTDRIAREANAQNSYDIEQLRAEIDRRALDESIDKWLKTATFAELAAAESDLADEAENTTVDEHRRIQICAKRARILAEMDKRHRRATTSRNALIPRMTFRDISDAELIGELARDKAEAITRQMSELAGLRRIAGIGTAYGIPMEIAVNGQTKHADIDALMRERVTVLLRLGEIIGEIGVQLTELRKTNGSATAEDMDYDESYSRIAEKIKKAEATLVKETGE